MQRQKEREKLRNLENYREKEVKRVTAYKKCQNPVTFKRKHHESTRRWRETKKVVAEGFEQFKQLPSPDMQKQILGKAIK